MKNNNFAAYFLVRNIQVVIGLYVSAILWRADRSKVGMRKSVSIFILIFVIVQVSWGAVNGDTVRVHADTVILFRFAPQRLMFYSPYRGNEVAIGEAMALIESHRAAIVRGDAVIRIRGFCRSYPSLRENLAAAKNRSNQVKSYFITHMGMREAYYRTSNEAVAYRGMGDIVALVGIEYRDAALVPVPDSVPEACVRSLPEVIPHRGVSLPVEPLVLVPDIDSMGWSAGAAVAGGQVRRARRVIPLSIKSNLLYDAVLMPSLELEYRFNRRWSVNLEGTMAWWHKDSKHRYYQLAQISPEVRYWFSPQGARRGHYVGLFVGGGWYDLENGGRGYKGEDEHAGLSYGYMFPVGRYFALEAGVGVGFLHTDLEEYVPLDGHYVYRLSSRTNYFGPLKLKLAFVWDIGYWMRMKGGGR